MNKKVLTLLSVGMLFGSTLVVPAFATEVAPAAFKNAISEHVLDVSKLKLSDNVIELTGNVNLTGDDGIKYVVLKGDAKGVTITAADGKEVTFTGRIVVATEDVTINGLTIVNKAVDEEANGYWTKNAITAFASNLTVTKNTIKMSGAAENTTPNGIVIFPQSVSVSYNVTGNTFMNGTSKNESYQSSAILVSQGATITEKDNDPLKDDEELELAGYGKTATPTVTEGLDSSTFADNTFTTNDADVIAQDEDVITFVQVSANANGNLSANSKTVLTDAIKSAQTEGQTTITVNGANAATVQKAIASLTDGDVAGKNIAIVTEDKNIIYGTASVDNDNPSVSNGIAQEYAGTSVVAKPADGQTYLLSDGENGFIAFKEGKISSVSFANSNVPEAQWTMKKTETNGVYTYVFTNKLGETLTLAGNTDEGIFYGSGDYSASGITLKLGQNNKNYLSYSSNKFAGSQTPTLFALYETAEMGFQADYLNDLEGSSFALTIKDNEDDDATLEGAEAFDSSIVAEPTNTAETTYKFKVGDKYIVLDTEDSWSNKGVVPSGLGYKFKTISAETLKKDEAKDAPRYISEFTIYYLAGDNTDAALDPTEKTAIERIGVMIDGDEYSLATYNSDGKYYLTVADQDNAEEVKLLANITFGGGNRADITELLTGKFVNIEFVNKQYKLNNSGKVDENQKYKMGKMLAMQIDKNGNLKAEYIGTTKGEYPEAQWAVKYNDNNTATFINRENPNVKVEEVALYNTKTDGVYAISSLKGASHSTNISSSNVLPEDTIKLTFVTTSMFDGFKHDITNLQDTIYNIAAFKAVNEVNDAYWVEKNHSTTHQIGLDGDIENAGEWNLHVAMKQQIDEDGEPVFNEKDEPVMVPDTVFVKSTLYTWDSSKQQPKPQESVLAIFPYAIQNNDNNEYVKYDPTHGVDYYVADKDNKTSAEKADNFALKIQPDGYHIVTLSKNYTNSDDYNALYGSYDNEVGDRTYVIKMGDKVFAGNAALKGTLDKVANYTSVYNDVMTITPVEMPEYRPVVKANEAAFDTVRIYRDENHSQLLYEKKDQKSGISFLNIDNENQFELADAIFVDTAYVNRGNNTRWQYLLVVQPNNVSEWYCPVNEEHNTEAWREENGVDHCHDAIRKNYVEGRFLVNLMDTANVYETTTQHDNPYIHEVEAGDMKAKLAFVPGKHFGDSLVLYKDAAMTQVKDSLFLGESDFNIAKFAFRYEDNATGSFKIQTQYKKWLDGDLRAANEDWAKPTNEGYLRWVNGTLVVDEGYDKGDVFNMTENYVEGNPTANESIEANGAVSVTATDGAVIIKGAAGKNVVIATILGKVVANETINSDNETIAVPAGIAVVSVDGESFKVVVK